MKLTHLRIEQFRQFRQPLEIADLHDGINLFTGPNEAGKSTVVAAIRAAFFERFRSNAAEDFRPWDDPSASPSVSIAFEHNGQRYELMKRFLGRKRCELRIGTRVLDGTEAEDALAAFMGFQHPGKGASKAEHWGIPGLLWIQQGSGHDIHDAVAHASGHLRTALEASVGEIASSQGDDLIAQVQRERDALLTASTGKPRGAYAAVLEKADALQAELAALDTEIAEYRNKVDTLAQLRGDHTRDAAEQPWAAFRAQEKAAADRLREVQALQDAVAMERAQAARWETLAELAANRLEAFAAEDRAVVARDADVARAAAAHAAAVQLVEPWLTKLSQAEAAHAQARERLERSRRAETRQRLDEEYKALEAAAQTAAQALAHAEAEQARLMAHQQQAAGCQIDEKTLQRLRQAQVALRELELRRAGVATRLRYSLRAGGRIGIQDQVLEGEGERLLIEPVTLTLPELGEIEIVPGGADAAALRREQEQWTARRDDLLARLGVAAAADAEDRYQSYLSHAAEARHAEATLKGLAPRGVDSLRAELAAIRTRLAELQRGLAALPKNDDAPGSLDVPAAEAALEQAERAVRDASEGLHAAQLAEGHARVTLEAAERERDAARAIVEKPERSERRAAVESDVAQATAQRQAAMARAEALARQVAQSRPDILAQDIERLRRSAEQHEKRHAERRDAIFRLEAELQAAGAHGLDERRAELARDLAQAQRQASELTRRARALDHLLGLLRQARDSLMRRLQAPLRRALQHYVELLFAGAQVEIEEDLKPGALIRLGDRGPETAPFETLSFGAREQLALIARLAYADLLRESGRPTLIILDDALVHSDEARLAQMKRVLFDAGTRHQILLFTCHPSQWRDLGAAPRRLGGIVA
ncbi:hypothetical protein CAL14_01340 [Bordetella genomosp. 9]|uniref:AAA family ATPase n=1 Tax=Bordetella genomosp. 9 TaxID=1416803 RepID=UPI000A293B47|nr:AAA family ATPase [Bordetella genomosp. 9]ARP89107.1 hypothetical protein CAL14_01340 [Bordetella genomosp. 9]